jgi:hypothetical protein
MLEIVHMTMAYSNAVLVAILPYVSDFAKKLDIPIQQPITTNQVVWSHITPYKDWIDGGFILTNQCWFGIDHRGYVNGYRYPINVFFEQEFTDESLLKYFGHDNMTTNEALELARQTFLKLGWNTNLTHSYETPEIRGPYDLHKPGRVGGHVPYCQFTWEWPKGEDNMVNLNHVIAEINLETKRVVGLTFTLSRTNIITTTPIKVNVVPELESDFQKRLRESSGKMFINTNAPQRYPKAPPN